MVVNSDLGHGLNNTSNNLMNNDWDKVKGILGVENLSGEKTTGFDFNKTIIQERFRELGKDSINGEKKILEKFIESAYENEGEQKIHKAILKNMYDLIGEELKKNNPSMGILQNTVSGIDNTTYLKWLNNLFWGIDDKDSSDGKMEFIKAVNNIYAQKFSIVGNTIPRDIDVVNLKDTDFSSGSNGLLNFYRRIQDLYLDALNGINTGDENTLTKEDKKLIAVLKKEQQNASLGRNKSPGKVTLDLVIKTKEKVAKQLMEKLQYELANEIYDQLNSPVFMEEANNYFEQTIEIFDKIDSESRTTDFAYKQLSAKAYKKEKGKYVPAKLTGLYSQYEYYQDGDKVILLPIAGYKIDYQKYTTILKDKIQDNFEKKLKSKGKKFESLELKEYKDIVQESFNEVRQEINLITHNRLVISGKKKITIDISSIQVDEASKILVDLIDNNSSDSDTVLQELEEGINKHTKDSRQIFEKSLLPAWKFIYTLELAKISPKAAEYFEKTAYEEIKKEILKDFDNEAQGLEQEVFKSLKTYYRLGHTSKVAGYISNFNGTIGEIFTTYLLRKRTGDKMTISQTGRDTSTGYQSLADIVITYPSSQDGLKEKYGLQVKQYGDKSMELYTATSQLEYAGKYISEEEQKAFLWMIGNELIFPEKYQNKNNIENVMNGFLYTRMNNFVRYSDLNVRDLKNYFYIISMNVIPASMIFLFFLYKIGRGEKIVNALRIVGEKINTDSTAKQINQIVWKPHEPEIGLDKQPEYVRLNETLSNSNLLGKYYLGYRGITFNPGRDLTYFL